MNPLVKYVTVTPTVDTGGAYTSGDRCGSLMTLSNVVDENGAGVMLESILIISKVVITSPNFYVMFFNDTPTIASADNAAIDVSDAEMAAKFIGLVTVTSSKALASGCILENVNTMRALECADGSKDLYALAVVEAAPTFTSTTDLVFRFKFRQV